MAYYLKKTKMKIIIKILVVILFASTILTSCSSGSKNSRAQETNTCASCGASFDWACTTDVFGECVCSEGCSGR